MYEADNCPSCHAELVGVCEDVSVDKRRWRHIYSTRLLSATGLPGC
jgi:hypothetical protein